jgi:hypothetical protein
MCNDSAVSKCRAWPYIHTVRRHICSVPQVHKSHFVVETMCALCCERWEGWLAGIVRKSTHHGGHDDKSNLAVFARTPTSLHVAQPRQEAVARHNPPTQRVCVLPLLLHPFTNAQQLHPGRPTCATLKSRHVENAHNPTAPHRPHSPKPPPDARPPRPLESACSLESWNHDRELCNNLQTA